MPTPPAPTFTRSCEQCEQPFTLRVRNQQTVDQRFCSRLCYRDSTKRTRTLCVTDGCGRLAHARGLCSPHYNATYYAARVVMMRQRAQAWYRANPERAAASRLRRDPASMRAAARAYYADHADERRAKQRERNRVDRAAVREIERRSAQANRDSIRLKNMRRRAAKEAAAGIATLQQVKARLAFFGNRCWMCERAADCIDHVKPLSQGGSNWPANLRPACRSCNSRKANQWKGVGSLASLRLTKVA